MSHSTPMKVAAAVTLVFGLAMLLAPNALMAFYNAQPLNSTGIYNSMLYGAALIGFAASNWIASTQPGEVRYPVVLGTFVGSLLGLLVALLRMLTVPDMPPMGWLNVLIFAAYTVVYGLLLRAPHQVPTVSAGNLR